MKSSKFTDSQIIEGLKRVEASLTFSDLCRELGVSSATFYKWRAKYGGMQVSLNYPHEGIRDRECKTKKRCMLKST